MTVVLGLAGGIPGALAMLIFGLITVVTFPLALVMTCVSAATGKWCAKPGTLGWFWLPFVSLLLLSLIFVTRCYAKS